MAKKMNPHGKLSRCNRSLRKGLWKGKPVSTQTKK